MYIEPVETLREYTLHAIKKLDIKPRKSLGQHFLISNKVRDRILDLVLPVGGITVIEIGGGLGALTIPLSELASRFVVYEIDETLMGYLKATISGYNPEVVMLGDFLKGYPPCVLPDRDFKIVGNIPYQITAPILELIYDSEFIPNETVIMVQREVAERITAPPGTKRRGRLTLWCEFHAEVVESVSVKKSSFYPSPDVGSTVLKFVTRKKLPLEFERKDDFFKMVKMSFAMKRKTLANNLDRWSDRFEKAEIESIIEKLGIPIKARAEEISLDDLVAIFHSLSN